LRSVKFISGSDSVVFVDPVSRTIEPARDTTSL